MKNILFVLVDQMRADTIHALGNPFVHTPVLDGLVKRGIAFSRAYTPSPVCVPARYSLHTGKMPHETGIFENSTLPSVNKNCSFMKQLSDEGYQAFGAGKMHFCFPEGWNSLWGFTERKICDEDERLEKNDYYQDLKKNGYGYVYDYKGPRGEMYYIPQTSLLPAHLHHTYWTAQQSIDFLERREKDKPFFIMTSFERPHPPFAPPIPWNKLYRSPDMPLPKRPDNGADVLTLWNHFQNRYKYRDQGEDNHLIRQMKAYYYAEISFIDYNLGRIVKQLEKEKCLDDTMIIFTSDHGEFLGDYHCYGKRSFLDAAAKIPFIMVIPGEKQGIICDEPISLVDIYPTIMEYAKIKEKDPLAGEALQNILSGDSQREYVVGEYEQGEYANYMIVDKRFKYIYSIPDEKEYLFDYVKDPEECMNRAYNPMYIKKTRQMKRKLIEYFYSVGYNENIEGEDWKKYGKKTMNSSPDAYLLFQDSLNTVQHIPGYTDGDEMVNKEWHEFSWLTDSFQN